MALLLFLVPVFGISQKLSIIPEPQSVVYREDSVLLYDSTYPILSQILTKNYDSIIGDEGYYLHISKDSFTIRANTRRGLFRGSKTQSQIFNSCNTYFIPCCDITDYPAYSYRAMHLDICRHFFSKDFIKKYIDQLAYYKINTLHWHLTDDQGWRIEVKTVVDCSRSRPALSRS